MPRLGPRPHPHPHLHRHTRTDMPFRGNMASATTALEWDHLTAKAYVCTLEGSDAAPTPASKTPSIAGSGATATTAATSSATAATATPTGGGASTTDGPAEPPAVAGAGAEIEVSLPAVAGAGAEIEVSLPLTPSLSTAGGTTGVARARTTAPDASQWWPTSSRRLLQPLRRPHWGAVSHTRCTPRRRRSQSYTRHRSTAPEAARARHARHARRRTGRSWRCSWDSRRSRPDSSTSALCRSTRCTWRPRRRWCANTRGSPTLGSCRGCIVRKTMVCVGKHAIGLTSWDWGERGKNPTVTDENATKEKTTNETNRSGTRRTTERRGT